VSGPTPGYVSKIAKASPFVIDVGVSAGLAVYCVLEFGSTGSFGWQRSVYATPSETKAGVLLGISAGFLAAGWLYLHPITRLFGGRSPKARQLEAVPTGPTGLRGNDPSPRSLPRLLLGDISTIVLVGFGFMALVGVLLVPAASYAPEALSALSAAGLLGFLAFVWSRVARLRRLCRTGAEVEGRFVKLDSDDTGNVTARYSYSYGGVQGEVSNGSWFLKRLAMRYGERVIVLLDPRTPGDAVILGRYPTS
jgi:hypothetical protein